MRRWVGLGFALAVVGCASDVSTLGLGCGQPCGGSWCQSSGAGIDEVCGPSQVAGGQCIGTSGMYCTKPCAVDDDCQADTRPMRCLTACDEYPEATGMCWSTPDWQFMTEDVCPL